MKFDDSKDVVLWVKPNYIIWGMIDFERGLFDQYNVLGVKACYPHESSDVIESCLNYALKILPRAKCVIHDGVALIPGLSVEIEKLGIPCVSYPVDYDDAGGFEFDGDSSLVLKEIELEIRLYKKHTNTLIEKLTHKTDVNTDTKKRVFISYSHVDKIIVQQVAFDLRDKYEIWVDFLSLKGGQRWENEIEKNIKNGDKLIVFMSEKGLSKKGYFQSELKKANKIKDMFPEDSIFIIPCRINDCAVPSFINDFHYLDYFSYNYSDFISQLCKSLDIE